MKITDKRDTISRKLFGNLERGATFIADDGTICIKVDDPENGLEYFAVALATGYSFQLDVDDIVTPIDAELIVHRTL